jgi:acyl-coenzyme A synthetase/AMP-(fatty) acid ligase
VKCVREQRRARNRADRILQNGLAPYKYPRWINFVTELPKTATGKIQRFLLRQK